MEDEIRIRYRFEKAPRPPHGGFGQLAAAVSQLVEGMPWAVPDLPFGTTSRVTGGLLQAFPVRPPMSQHTDNSLRLKAIESPQGILLEHSYDNDGRLAATSYPDGVRVGYRWDTAGHLSDVRSSDGKSISYSYNENGWLKLMKWSGGAQFHYQYDGFGNLTKCIYPDQKSIAYFYDGLGRPLEASFDQCRFVYDWDGDGRLRRVLLQARGQVHELVASQGRLSIDLATGAGSNLNEVELASPLGIWVHLSDGRLLEEMWLSSGERLCLGSRKPGRREGSVWDLSGQTDYHYDDGGILKAIMQANGKRTVFHRVPKRSTVYAVSADGVALYEYDGEGRLSKVRYESGDYVILSYGRSGAAIKLTTASGWTELRHSSAGRLSAVRTSTGQTAQLSYGADGWPKSALLKAVPDAIISCLVLARTFWQWVVLREALRLHDVAPKEA